MGTSDKKLEIKFLDGKPYIVSDNIDNSDALIEYCLALIEENEALKLQNEFLKVKLNKEE